MWDENKKYSKPFGKGFLTMQELCGKKEKRKKKNLKDSKREAIYNDVLVKIDGMWGSNELLYNMSNFGSCRTFNCMKLAYLIMIKLFIILDPY